MTDNSHRCGDRAALSVSNLARADDREVPKSHKFTIGDRIHALGAATGNIGRAASNEGDAMVTAACRRIIAADRIEWRKHGDALERASDPTSGASSALRK
jgi:hypothetical protein